MADDNHSGRRQSRFTAAEVNRAVQAAKKAAAYAVEITPERITIILQSENQPERKPITRKPRALI
jgi:hypothetical protein